MKNLKGHKFTKEGGKRSKGELDEQRHGKPSTSKDVMKGVSWP